jgi:hypothetical protein
MAQEINRSFTSPMITAAYPVSGVGPQVAPVSSALEREPHVVMDLATARRHRRDTQNTRDAVHNKKVKGDPKDYLWGPGSFIITCGSHGGGI